MRGGQARVFGSSNPCASQAVRRYHGGFSKASTPMPQGAWENSIRRATVCRDGRIPRPELLGCQEKDGYAGFRGADCASNVFPSLSSEVFVLQCPLDIGAIP